MSCASQVGTAHTGERSDGGFATATMAGSSSGSARDRTRTTCRGPGLPEQRAQQRRGPRQPVTTGQPCPYRQLRLRIATEHQVAKLCPFQAVETAKYTSAKTPTAVQMRIPETSATTAAPATTAEASATAATRQALLVALDPRRPQASDAENWPVSWGGGTSRHNGVASAPGRAS